MEREGLSNLSAFSSRASTTPAAPANETPPASVQDVCSDKPGEDKTLCGPQKDLDIRLGTVVEIAYECDTPGPETECGLFADETPLLCRRFAMIILSAGLIETLSLPIRRNTIPAASLLDWVPLRDRRWPGFAFT